MLLWLLFVLSSCVCQGQPAVVGSAGLWSGGLTIPWSGAQAARDFPQGTRTSTGYSLGLTIGKTAPGLATDFMSIGVHRRFKVFHAALFGSAVGDRLYSEYGLGIREAYRRRNGRWDWGWMDTGDRLNDGSEYGPVYVPDSVCF